MSATVNRKYGNADVFELQEVEIPTHKDEEVLVEVHAASTNAWDWDYLILKPYLYCKFFGC